MKNNLKFLMESKGVGVTELSRSINVSRPTVYRVLNGGTPSAALMLKLSGFFNKHVNDIFFDPNVRHVVRNERGVV